MHDALSDDEREAFELLVDNGFIVENRDSDRRALDSYFTR